MWYLIGCHRVRKPERPADLPHREHGRSGLRRRVRRSTLPKANALAERVIGMMRRECLDRDRAQRSASPPSPAWVRDLLQRRSSASVARPRTARWASSAGTTLAEGSRRWSFRCLEACTTSTTWRPDGRWGSRAAQRSCRPPEGANGLASSTLASRGWAPCPQTALPSAVGDPLLLLVFDADFLKYDVDGIALPMQHMRDVFAYAPLVTLRAQLQYLIRCLEDLPDQLHTFA